MSVQPQMAIPQAGPCQMSGSTLQTPQQIIIVTQPRNTRASRRAVVHESYKAKRSVGIGWALIALGFAAMSFNIANIIVQGNRGHHDENWPVYIGTGIWCGCFYIISGGLAIGAGQRRTTSMIRGNMAMGIIGVIFGVIDLSWVIAALANEDVDDNYGQSNSSQEDDDTYRSVSYALSAMSLLIAIVVMALCVCATELAGRILCRSEPVMPQPVMSTQGVPIQTMPGTGQPVMVFNMPSNAFQAGGYQDQVFGVPQAVPASQTPPPSYVAEEAPGQLPTKDAV